MEDYIQVQLQLMSEVLEFSLVDTWHPIHHQLNQIQIGTISFDQFPLNENFNLKLKRHVRSEAVSPPVTTKKLKTNPKPQPKMETRPATVNTAGLSGNSPKIDVSSMMKIVQSVGSNDKTYQCAYCGSESTHMSSMKRHIESKHLPSTVVFNCRSCSYSSKYKHDLKKHYMKVHNMPEPAAQGMLVC